MSTDEPEENPWRDFLSRRVVALAEVVAGGGALCTALGLLPSFHPFLDVLTSVRHLVALGTAAALVVLVVQRRRVMALVAAVTAAVNLGFVVDTFSVGEESCAPNLTVVALNALGPDVDVMRVIDLVEHEQVDVVVVTELAGALDTALKKEYRHHYSAPREGTAGIGIFSRFPLYDMEVRDGEWFPQLHGSVASDRGRFYLVAAHPPPPFTPSSAVLRNRELADLTERLKQIDGALVVAGDLNVTRQSTHFRQLLDIGLKDTRLGEGVEGTWPYPLPFRVGIDHVLHSEHFDTCALDALDSVGSDHLPIIARLHW